MAEPKVQLVAPIGNISVPGMNVTGVITATSISGNVGVAGSIIQGSNLDIGAGIITATSFVGDQIGTYRAASLTGSPDLVVGVVTSSGFVAPITGDVTGNLTGNVVGTAKSILSGNNLWVGIATATLVGPASNLVGVAASSFTHQTVTANSGTTAIDLSVGNIITFNQSSNTTVSFANTSSAMSITLIRDKDDNNTARTISWPDSISWDGGSAPTLLDDSESGNSQQFQFLTRDGGLTWYGWETFKNEPTRYELFVRGFGEQGATAQNNRTNYSSPIQVGTEATWASVHSGSYAWHMNARKTDGTLWGWGRNQNGQLGQNDRTQPSSPVQIPGTTWSVNMDVSYDQVQAIKTDGTLWSWGYNGEGNLGHNNTIKYSSPVQVPGTTWSVASSGQKNAGALKTDGTMWVWGYNHYGSIGDNSRIFRSSPVQVPGTTWSKIDVGRAVTAAIKTDGTLWTWGINSEGALGLSQSYSTISGKSSPTQVGTDTTWKEIHVTLRAMGAVKTDGTLWMWGQNYWGSMGLNEGNSNTKLSSPTQVGTDTTWNALHKVSGSGYYGQYSVASKTDGTMWVWGPNDDGNLGLNNGPSVWRSSPTQLPGTNWGIESYQFAQGNAFGGNLRSS